MYSKMQYLIRVNFPYPYGTEPQYYMSLKTAEKGIELHPLQFRTV